MKIYCIGNSVISGDTLPSLLITEIEKAFPDAGVSAVDPSENFYPEEKSILIDSVEGIDQVEVFRDINVFMTTKSASVHDYDLGLHLQLLQKLHKLPALWIIGVPRFREVNEVLPAVISAIANCSGKERKHKCQH